MCRKVCIPWIVHNNELLPILVKHNAPLFQQLSSSLDPAIGLLCKQGKYLQCGQTSISVCIGTSQFASYSWLLSRTKQAANTAHIRGKRYLFNCFGLQTSKQNFMQHAQTNKRGVKKQPDVQQASDRMLWHEVGNIFLTYSIGKQKHIVVHLT